ncbi:TSUP family transporter [Desulfogranum mediterraneum]|uniref:TSUP family transporter n=1 Tax=Desulfogranum mediterraneum TaxID=160661 RepID=UPI00040AA855|nr:TSUP family transporter [Desulfogranum mediterraneum]
MEITQLSTELLSFLFVTAFVAGFLDTLAGGGGLISLPALILSGIPPLSALGTNKLQGSMGTATATYVMLSNKRVRWSEVKQLMLSAFVGSLLGTIAVQFMNPEILNFVVPTVLVVISIYFLLAPQPKIDGGRSRISSAVYQKTVVPLIGWYDGMFGPGTGSFFAFSGVSLRGQGLIEATAVAKTLNFSTNFASLAIFLIAGKVAWLAGMVMILGQFAGAWLGSHCLFKIDHKILRLIVVAMCLLMLLRYTFSMGWLS